MEKFESILENWVNGNRGDVRKAVEALSSYENQSFGRWLKEKYSEEWHDRSELFSLVCFIAFA